MLQLLIEFEQAVPIVEAHKLVLVVQAAAHPPRLLRVWIQLGEVCGCEGALPHEFAEVGIPAIQLQAGGSDQREGSVGELQTFTTVVDCLLGDVVAGRIASNNQVLRYENDFVVEGERLCICGQLLDEVVEGFGDSGCVGILHQNHDFACVVQHEDVIRQDQQMLCQTVFRRP